MTPELQALARRAVACRHWRWLPGMRSVSPGGHSRRLDPPPNATGLHPWWTWSEGECEEGLPDLSDPCSLGGLLALVRAAWGKPGIHARRRGVGIWAVYADPWLKRKPFGRGGTEAAALVAALEAAP